MATTIGACAVLALAPFAWMLAGKVTLEADTTTPPALEIGAATTETADEV